MGDARAAPGIAAVLGELLQPRDLPLALASDRIVLRQPFDQPPDAVPDLEGEVRRRWAGQGPDVLNHHRPGQPVGSLRLAHFLPFFGAGSGSPSMPPGWAPLPWEPAAPIGASSESSSISACTRPPIAVASPISQTWLYTARVGSVS